MKKAHLARRRWRPLFNEERGLLMLMYLSDIMKNLYFIDYIDVPDLSGGIYIQFMFCCSPLYNIFIICAPLHCVKLPCIISYHIARIRRIVESSPSFLCIFWSDWKELCAYILVRLRNSKLCAYLGHIDKTRIVKWIWFMFWLHW